MAGQPLDPISAVGPDKVTSLPALRVAGIRIPLQPLQVGADVCGVLITQIAVFLQALVDNAFQQGRQVGIQAHCRSGNAVQYRLKDHSGSVAAKRQCSRRHLVQNRTEREQIGSYIQILAFDLLR